MPGVPGLRHGVVIELAFGREEHAFPPLRAEPTAMEVGAANQMGFFWPCSARFRLRVPGGQRITVMGGSTEFTYSSTTAELRSRPHPGTVQEVPKPPWTSSKSLRVVWGTKLRSHSMPSTSRSADFPWKKRTRRSQVLNSTKTGPCLSLLGL